MNHFTCTIHVKTLAFALSVALLTLVLPATAEQAGAPYPSKPVRIVVPYPAGGGTDLMARFVAQHLTSALGQAFIVDNRAGASGNLGLEQVARAPADGYTLVMMPSNLSINPPLFRDLKFDPVADFTPIALVGSSPVMLAVHSSVPVRSVKELVAYARARPGTLSYASCGNGTPQHLAGELFKAMAKVDMVHVPYKGCAPAVTDLVGGQVPVGFSTLANLAPHMKSGKVVGLAVTGARRTDLAPDLPTVSADLPGYEVDVWFGLLGPAHLPPSVVTRLNAEVNRMLSDSRQRADLLAKGFDAYGGTPEQFGTLILGDLQRWGKLIKDVRIKAD